ncbi:MAG: UDP-N-acetyl-D-glucosamine dehydrogenase [Candidatus Binatia bacterium]|nr:MAG: UDP-N-acetyl-D-glucosamine dehydrogenase [Candidatus Binatia bacterium]
MGSTLPSSVEALKGKFASREAAVGVIGLGYVGLPLASLLAEGGFAVFGFDVDENKVAELRRGKSYIHHIPSSRVASVVTENPGERGKFFPTTGFSSLQLCDGILICVPTPLTESRDPDLSFVVRTSETIAQFLRPGQLVVLESTTYPGTTDEVVRPILESRGLRAGVDFYLAFSPEREDPNNREFTTRDIPKLVGGVTEACREVACALYGAVVRRVVPVSSAKVAEAAKLLENIYRCVNIALVNELKVLFDRMGLDVWEVIDAAATKPFGFTPFYPGPGLGGHCIPIDPFYLTWKARQYDLATRFIELAGEVNRSMPQFVVEKLTDALNARYRSVRGSKILLLGVAYKRDLDDTRESPALRLIEILRQKGAEVDYNDPYVPVLKRSRKYDFGLRSVPLDEKTLGSYDAVVITTDHSVYDYEKIVRSSRLVVDTRNATKNVRAGRENVILA